MDKVEENRLIKERLFHYLEKERLNPNQLARISNVTQSSLNNIINRPSVPTITTIRKLCEGLDISVVEFLNFEPYNQAPQKKVQKSNETELAKRVDEMNSEIDNLKKIIDDLKKH